MKPLLALFAAAMFATPSFAGPPGPELRKATPCCWETLFRQGDIGCGPCGATRGTVLYVDGKLPRVKARVQGAIWKGKTFHGDGTFTNRWLGGIQAISAGVCEEPSWLDGAPCLVMQYAPDAPVFGNVRDELRQIAPGVWLGRSYDGASGNPKNWFVLREK
jgi:hypothetical protein